MPSATRRNLRLGLLRLAGSFAPAPTRTTPRKVLLVRPDHVGDVLLTAPAVSLLRASLPEAHITYLVGPWSREAAERGPAVDEIRTVAFPGFTRDRNVNLLAPYALALREAQRLRQEHFDLAVVFRPDHWWGALLVSLARIPLRVGADTPETQMLLSHVYATPPQEHWAEQALGIVRLALNVTATPAAQTMTEPFRVSDQARADAAKLWKQYGLENKTIVALQPSAGAPLKRWPRSRWADLAAKLQDAHTAVILTGGPADRALLGELPWPTFTGQSLDVTAAIFERCDLVIGLDGGAAHLAAAIGTPTIRLYGPASSDVFGPYPPRHPDHTVLVSDELACVPCGNLDQPPCGARTLPACLLAIGSDDVVKAAKRQLSHS